MSPTYNQNSLQLNLERALRKTAMERFVSLNAYSSKPKNEESDEGNDCDKGSEIALISDAICHNRCRCCRFEIFTIRKRSELSSSQLWTTTFMGLLIAFIAVNYVQAQQKAAIYAQIFNSSYDMTQRPNLQFNIPTQIYTNFRVNLLFSISAPNEMYSLDLYVREIWLDSRLSFDAMLWPVDIYGPLRIPGSNIWRPDTFFYNAISCVTPDELVTLNNTGWVKWARHMTCQLHVSFQLQDFPFDSQTFFIERQSFSYSSQELVLNYSDPCFLPDPGISWENSLWNFVSVSCQDSTFTFRQSPYSQVIGSINVSRKSTSYILKNVLPMFVIVCLSTLTYWIDANSPPARVGGTITLVLSIVTFNLVVSSDLPKINYSTLLDWYVWKCFLFVVFAVAEFAFVNHVLWQKKWNPSIAYLTDDFCQWTILPTWLMSNLLYWPGLLSSISLIGFVACLEVLYFAANLYRVYWNYKNNHRGMVIPVKRLFMNFTLWCIHLQHRIQGDPLLGLRYDS